MMKKTSFQKGFTIIELVVSVAIFALMTALLLAKYGTFNQGILLTNLAYDVALTIRNAQSYGLNVKSVPAGGLNYSNQFDYAYGVHFDKSSSGNPAANTQVIFFADLDGDREYDTGEKISAYTIKRGNYVHSFCGGPGSCSVPTVFGSVDITFKRPNPDATIIAKDTTGGLINASITYLIIYFSPPTGAQKKIRINSAGQINITD